MTGMASRLTFGQLVSSLTYCLVAFLLSVGMCFCIKRFILITMFCFVINLLICLNHINQNVYRHIIDYYMEVSLSLSVLTPTAVVKIRRLFLNRFWGACLIFLPHIGTMCLTLPRFVSGSALLISHCYAPCETPESVSDLLLWCLRLHYYAGYSQLTCHVPLGSDHWDAAGRGGSEIHSCAGARSPMGQCKFSILKSALSPELPVYIQNTERICSR